MDADADQRKLHAGGDNRRLDAGDLLAAVRGDIPETTADERKWLRQELDATLTLLRVWLRATNRQRSPRRRMAALWIAQGLLGAKPDELDRAKLARQDERLAAWHEIGRTETQRRGYPPTTDEVWRIFEQRYGGPRRIEWGHYPPKTMRDGILAASDGDVACSDRVLEDAVLLLLREPSRDGVLFRYHLARQHIERLQALPRGSGARGSSAVHPVLASYRVLLLVARYVAEVARGRLPLVWYCFGCDDWHSHSRGAPPRFHRILMDLQMRAMSAGGLDYGDAKRIYHLLRSEGRQLPTYGRWCRYIREHHLRRGEDCRGYLVRLGGEWAVLQADLGSAHGRERLAALLASRNE